MNYPAYIKEREGKDVFETEEGFAVFGFNCLSGLDFPHVYLQDIWVKPDKRRSGVASHIADKVAHEANLRGIKIMVGSVDAGANEAHKSLLVLIGYGMTLFKAHDGIVYFVKEI